MENRSADDIIKLLKIRIQNKETHCAISLNLTKAFGGINRVKLLKTLYEKGVPRNSLKVSLYGMGVIFYVVNYMGE